MGTNEERFFCFFEGSKKLVDGGGEVEERRPGDQTKGYPNNP